MKFNKIIAAASAVAMIGSLAVVPASAKTVNIVPSNIGWAAWELSNNNTLNVDGTSLTKQDRDNFVAGNTLVLTANAQSGIIQARSNASDVTLKADTEYTISFDYDLEITGCPSLTNNNDYNTAGAYLQIGNSNYLVNSSLRGVTEFPVSKKGTYTRTYTPTSDATLQNSLKLYWRRVSGTVTYSNISVTYDDGTPVEPEVTTPSGKLTQVYSSVDDTDTNVEGDATAFTFLVTPNDATGNITVNVADVGSQTNSTNIEANGSAVLFGLAIPAIVDKAAISASLGGTAIVIE